MKNNYLIDNLYIFAENLRKNKNFKEASIYYKNFISYSNKEKKGYYGLFLAAIKCSNELEEREYICNLDDPQYFQNLVALENNDEDRLKLINKYVDFIFSLSKDVELINDVVPNNGDRYKAFEIIISFYPDSYNDQYINSLEKMALLTLQDYDFDESKNYYTKLISINDKNANYYLHRLLASVRCKKLEQLKNQLTDFTEMEDYQNALKYADAKMLEDLLSIEKQWKELIYIYNKNLKEKQEKIHKEKLEEKARIEHARILEKRSIEQKRILDQQILKEKAKEKNIAMIEKTFLQFKYVVAFILFFLSYLFMFYHFRDFRFNSELQFLSIFLMLFSVLLFLFPIKKIKQIPLIIVKIVLGIILIVSYFVIYSVGPMSYWEQSELGSLTEGYSYEYNCYYGGGKISYVDELEEINIPDKINGVKITYVRIKYPESIKKMKISNFVEEIKIGMYSKFYSLSELKFSENCNLKTLGILNYTNISSFEIPRGYKSIPNDCFSGNKKLKKIIIPNSVTSIGGSAFYNCESLTSITIPKSVTSIGNYAFCRCTSLTNITIPNSVTSVGDSAFYNCESLTSITIPYSVKTIEERTFFGCKSLNEIHYNGTISNWNSVQCGTDWVKNTLVDKIICTDGEVSI